MNKKSSMTAGILNFFLPGIGVVYVVGRRFAIFGFVAWITLVALQVLALAGAVIQEMPGIGFWFVLTLGHNICAGILAAAFVKARASTGRQE